MPRSTLCLARLTAVLLGIVLATARATAAQEPRRLTGPDSIPVELAMALVAVGGFGGEPQILVGAMPGWMADRIVMPPGARVLGAAFVGATTVAILRVTNAGDSVIADLARALPERGWKAPPPPPNYGGGFRPASMNRSRPGPVTTVSLCGDRQQLTASLGRRRAAEAIVVYRISGLTGYGTCSPPPVPPGMTPNPWPTLYNPAGAEEQMAGGECNQFSVGMRNTQTTIRTEMTPDAILEHYGRQLADSGWKSGEGSSSLTRTWTRPDSAGAPAVLSLTVSTSTLGAACRDVNLQVRPPRRP